MAVVDRQRAAQCGDEVGASLAGRGVRAVALTWVDNAGVTRASPEEIAEACRWRY
jgi:hypothetical protein